MKRTVLWSEFYRKDIKESNPKCYKSLKSLGKNSEMEGVPAWPAPGWSLSGTGARAAAAHTATARTAAGIKGEGPAVVGRSFEDWRIE